MGGSLSFKRCANKLATAGVGDNFAIFYAIDVSSFAIRLPSPLRKQLDVAADLLLYTSCFQLVVINVGTRYSIFYPLRRMSLCANYQG